MEELRVLQAVGLDFSRPAIDKAEFLRDETKKGQEEGTANVIGYGLGGRVFLIYYPEGKFADTLNEFDAELAAAAERGGPVYVVSGYWYLNLWDGDPADADSVASGAAKLADEDLFEEIAAYGGIDPLFYFRVLRLKVD